MIDDTASLLARLSQGQTTTWLRSAAAAPRVPGLPAEEIDAVERRFARFETALARLFPAAQWDGRIRSPLLPYSHPPRALPALWIKADHMLPMTGSVKARGGVHELLSAIEDFAVREKLFGASGDAVALLEPRARTALSRLTVIVASTGNLGFSVGLVARAFGVNVEIHMSSDAKTWKKDRLRSLGATVVEHETDYAGAVAAARDRARAAGAYFIDDERSRRLFAGYAVAGRELAQQLTQAGLQIGPQCPLVVYLPCGVGGAPGGITAGLLHEFGDNLISVFVEPIASACMLVALATGRRCSVYDFGLSNRTVADGLAVPTASELVLELVGPRIDAVVAVSDAALLEGVRRAWREDHLRLEPSAAAGLMAIEPFLAARELRGDPLRNAVHVVWTTGGSLLPDSEFLPLVADKA